MKPIVIAQFPRISNSSHHWISQESLASRGRLIGQALSFKLLAVAALLLIAVAVVPWTVGTSEKSPDVSTATTPAPQWEPNAPASATEVAVVAASPVASPSPLPEILPQPEMANTPPTPAVAEAPTTSPWPNPAHPINPLPEADGKPLETDVRPAIAIRPTDYD